MDSTPLNSRALRVPNTQQSYLQQMGMVDGHLRVVVS